MDFRSIPAFCINLDSRPDRWAFVKSQFDALGWPLARVPAVKAVYPEGFDSSKKWHPGQQLMPGQAACLASHRLVWEIASSSDSDFVAVFEDDSLFPSDFESVFSEAYEELPSNWLVWHLHSFGPNQEATAKRISPKLNLLVSNGYGSHGYLIRKTLTKKMIEEPLPENEPVDWLLTMGLKSRNYLVFGTMNENALCFQQTNESNIKETSVNEYYKIMIKKYYR